MATAAKAVAKPAAKKAAAKPKVSRSKILNPLAAEAISKGYLPGNFGSPDLTPTKVAPAAADAQLVEDCAACRMVWKTVEMDVGNLHQEKTIYDAFVTECRRAISAPILYSPCQLMFTRVDDMIASYIAGVPVEKVCADNGLCR